ncbi:hypothetical protein HAX54_039477 [Datura stramonium]|uniref:Uncharacterized protein n=1 Tax=Datura stramonium TaxID=4076 RepID=A0ABS8SJE6_DATST|nr:hypothetical protein [Datura stramonium]
MKLGEPSIPSRNMVEEVPLYDSGEEDYFPVIYGTSGGNENTKIPNDDMNDDSGFRQLYTFQPKWMKNEATSKLNSVYEEIRPIIKVYGRENRGSVPISIVKTWIEANCSKYKADFDLYFSVIKNVMYPRPTTDTTTAGPSKGGAGPQPTNAEVKPSEGGEE